MLFRSGAQCNVVFVGWSAPHSPWDYLNSFATCDYNGDMVAGDQRDDRVPGSVVTTSEELYEEAMEYVDTQMGLINAKLDLTTGNSSDLSIFFYDNGSHLPGRSTECIDSYGSKGTPFMCGVRAPLVMHGDVVPDEFADDNVSVLMSAADIPKTIVGMLGGTYRGQTDGIDLSDCVLGLNGQTPTSCTVGRDVLCTEGWAPNGGESEATTVPSGSSGIAAGEFFTSVRACYTQQCNGDWMIKRDYDVNIGGTTTEFCEQFYEIDGADNYQASANPPRAETDGNAPGCSGTVNGNALVADDFTSPSITTDEQCALDLLQPVLDRMREEDGVYPVTSTGVTF